MITFFTFPVLFLTLKNSFLLSFIVNLDTGLVLIFYIFPMVLFLIIMVNFNFLGSKEKFYYSILFLFVIFFLFFCFNSLRRIHFLIFLENCVIFIVFLIFWFSKDLDKVSAALFIFFINIFPSILFMYFCWNWDYSLLANCFFLTDSNSIIYFLCFSGLLVRKLPLFLFHFWLTKAHVRASGSGSMILASLMLKIGTIGFYKFYYFFFKNFKFFSSRIFFLSCLGMSFLLLAIIRFFDLKYIVACSSIVHIAPIFPLCMQGERFSIYSCFLIMVGHGLVSYFIFFLVRVLYEKTYNRSIDFNKSLSTFSTLLIRFIFFFFLLNLGFPPFCRFLRELIFLRCFSLLRFLLIGTFCLSLLLRGLVFFFVVRKSLFGKKLMFNSSGLNYNIYLYSFVFSTFFFSIPLIYSYFYSLKKNFVLWKRRSLK